MHSTTSLLAYVQRKTSLHFDNILEQRW